MVADSNVRITDAAQVHQMYRVLRMRVSDRCVLLDNCGNEFECTVLECSQRSVTLTVVEKRKNASESEISLTLFQALPKKMELFEWILQKGTEIGVSRFVPIITKFTEREGFPRRDRLEKILKEASEQSERGRIPKLEEPVEFNDALSSMHLSPAASTAVLLHSRGDFPAVNSLLPKIQAQHSCELFIGPEGGFSEEEVKAASNKGFSIASLGKRILRTETAGIVAGSVILYSV